MREATGREEDTHDRAYRTDTQSDRVGANGPPAMLSNSPRTDRHERPPEGQQKESTEHEGCGGLEPAADRHLPTHHQCGDAHE